MFQVCSLQNFLIVTKFFAPLLIEACTRHVQFSSRHFAMTLNIFKFEIIQNDKLFKCIAEMSLLEEGLPDSELNIP